MSHPRRVQQQSAYLLHHRPFRETSLLLDIFSRDYGRLALVARGARTQKSRLKALLRPFMPLSLSWVAKSDLGTLTGAELDGRPLTLSGDGLMSGYYLNELILQLLHRHDTQPEVFAAYAETIARLAASTDPAPALRIFELELLKLLGYAVTFGQDALSAEAIQPQSHYEYRAEQGPVKVSRDTGPMVFSGTELIAIREHRFEDPATLRAAGRLLRDLISFHLGGKELKSRKVLVDLHRSRVRMAEKRDAQGNNGSTE